MSLQNKRHSTSSWRSRSTNRLLMSTRVFHRKGFPFDKNRSVVNLVLSFMACCAELAGRGCHLLHRCVFLSPCSTLLLKLRLSDKETRRTRGACVPSVQVEGRGGRSGTYTFSHTSVLYYAKTTFKSLNSVLAAWCPLLSSFKTVGHINVLFKYKPRTSIPYFFNRKKPYLRTICYKNRLKHYFYNT